MAEAVDQLMRKKIIWTAVLVAAVLGVGFLTPVGRMCIDSASFIYLCLDYGRKERALEKQISRFTDDDYGKLANIVAQLTADYGQPEAHGDDWALRNKGDPIPEALGYLRPQRIWISEDSVHIELLHMMDADTSLIVKRDKERRWTVIGHFGDYMNPPRLLWTEPRLAKAL